MMITLISAVWRLVYWYLRPAIKWFLRRTTKLCELQRICYGEERGAPRTSGVEYSLSMTRMSELKVALTNLVTLAETGRFTEDLASNPLAQTMKIIFLTKKINPQVHRAFVTSINTCLLQIYGYKQLAYTIEQIRKIPYNSENAVHEKKLYDLWEFLMPDKPLVARISKQWTEIGFQGDDPKTDFRGMGCLGLENLLYFAAEHTEAARHVLSHSQHPQYGYSFAIVGINLTSLAYQFLMKGKLRYHFYNFVPGCPIEEDFHHVYCYFFFEFDKFWLAEKPQDIMEFNRIRTLFEDKMSEVLEQKNTVLNFNMAIETL